MALLLFVVITLSSCATGVLHEPIANASVRATPLSFGLQVTPDPETNPIDPPERFSGYHAATDFEVSAGEVDGDVPVYAICKGRVRFRGHVDGYGGLVVQSCTINKQAVTVLYGHLSLKGLPREGQRMNPGDVLGLLAPARSYESDMNRKHLHLGIHKGTELDVRGYVQSEEELEDYIDPQTVLASLFIDLPTDSPGETPYWQVEEEDEE